MNDNVNTTLVRDMALKALEDIGKVFANNHELIHHGGGNCVDATLAKYCVMKTLNLMADEGNPPANMLATADPIITELHSFLKKEIEEQKEQTLNPEIEAVLDKLFGRMNNEGQPKITVHLVGIGDDSEPELP